MTSRPWDFDRAPCFLGSSPPLRRLNWRGRSRLARKRRRTFWTNLARKNERCQAVNSDPIGGTRHWGQVGTELIDRNILKQNALCRLCNRAILLIEDDNEVLKSVASMFNDCVH